MNAPAWKSGDRCPGCGRNQWHVGRQTAECAFCQLPVPLADSLISASAPLTDQLRLVDLKADIDLSLAIRKAKRPRRSAAALKGHVTRRARRVA